MFNTTSQAQLDHTSAIFASKSDLLKYVYIILPNTAQQQLLDFVVLVQKLDQTSPEAYNWVQNTLADPEKTYRFFQYHLSFFEAVLKYNQQK